jgi:hypothetical protein
VKSAIGALAITHPSCPAIAVRRTASLRAPMCRASTPYLRCETKDVDGRDKPGHDECLRIFAVVSSIFGWVEGTLAAFHVKMFHAKQIGFQRLRKLQESIRRSCLTFISVTTNCATVSLNKGAF